METVAEHISIKCRKRFLKSVSVTTPNQVLYWKFSTTKKNIHFSLAWCPLEVRHIEHQFREFTALSFNEFYWNTRDGERPLFNISSNRVWLIPLERVYCHKKEVVGWIKAPSTAGYFELVFDNSSSIHRSKKISLEVKIVALNYLEFIHVPNTISYAMSQSVGATGSYSGWVYKKRVHIKGWSPRWAVFSPTDGIFRYYRRPGGQFHKAICISDGMLIQIPDRLRFILDTGHSLLHFKVSSPCRFSEWMVVLSAHLRGKKENTDKINRKDVHQAIFDSLERRISSLSVLLAKISTCDTEQLSFSIEQEGRSLLHLSEEIGQETFSILVDSPSVFSASTASVYLSAEDEFDTEEIENVFVLSAEETEALSDSSSMTEGKFQIDGEYLEIKSIMLGVFKERRACPPNFDNVLPFLPLGRQTLPHSQMVPVKGVSLFSILKASLGKDADAVTSMPVCLNEPMGLLQRLCEELGRADFLDCASICTRAASSPLLASVARLAFVTLFAISTFSISKTRTSRKPFTPMLGETFQYVDPDTGISLSHCMSFIDWCCVYIFVVGMRFMAERVLQLPPTVAIYAVAHDAAWHFWQDLHIQSKFWGRSVEIHPHGHCWVHFPDTDDKFFWSKVSSIVHNVIGGRSWVENQGRMAIELYGNPALTSFVDFYKEDSRKIKGQIMFKDRCILLIEGNWSDQVTFFSPDFEEKISIILQRERITNSEKKLPYGFTPHSVLMNDWVSDIRTLAPTDTRWRQDIRHYEEGRVEEADQEKKQIEIRSKKTAIRGSPPKWFTRSNGAGPAWLPDAAAFWGCAANRSFQKPCTIFSFPGSTNH